MCGELKKEKIRKKLGRQVICGSGVEKKSGAPRIHRDRREKKEGGSITDCGAKAFS